MEVRKTWIEERKDVANGRLCGSVIATRKVKRVRPNIGALHHYHLLPSAPVVKSLRNGIVFLLVELSVVQITEARF